MVEKKEVNKQQTVGVGKSKQRSFYFSKFLAYFTFLIRAGVSIKSFSVFKMSKSNKNCEKFVVQLPLLHSTETLQCHHALRFESETFQGVLQYQRSEEKKDERLFRVSSISKSQNNLRSQISPTYVSPLGIDVDLQEVVWQYEQCYSLRRLQKNQAEI